MNICIVALRMNIHEHDTGYHPSFTMLLYILYIYKTYIEYAKFLRSVKPKHEFLIIYNTYLIIMLLVRKYMTNSNLYQA